MSLPMAAGFAAFAIAQLSGWQDGEISATLCTWMGSRGKSLLYVETVTWTDKK